MFKAVCLRIDPIICRALCSICIIYLFLLWRFATQLKNKKLRDDERHATIRLFIYFLFRFICFLTFNFDLTVCRLPKIHCRLCDACYFDFFFHHLIQTENEKWEWNNMEIICMKLWAWFMFWFIFCVRPLLLWAKEINGI